MEEIVIILKRDLYSRFGHRYKKGTPVSAVILDGGDRAMFRIGKNSNRDVFMILDKKSFRVLEWKPIKRKSTK